MQNTSDNRPLSSKNVVFEVV